MADNFSLQSYKDFFANDRFAAHSGIELLECRPGYAKVQVVIQPFHLNGANVVHGGLIYTLADFACGVALNAHGLISLSVNSSISNFAKCTSGTLMAEAVEVSRSNKLSSCDVNVYDDAKTLIANFKGMAFITKAEIFFKESE